MAYDPIELLQMEMTDRLTAARIELEQMRSAKDSAYTERNRLVHALCSMAQLLGWRCGVRMHDSAGWDPAWRTIVIIDLPTGQASWHVHEVEVQALFKHLPVYPDLWDGHSTEEKYRRLAGLLAVAENFPRTVFSDAFDAARVRVQKNFDANGAPCAEETK